MPQKLVVILIALIILAAGAYLRLFNLEERPVHGDEANQALKTGILLEKGEYRYDPFEHHGPTLYYLTLPVLWVTGTSSVREAEMWQFRLVPAAFGILVILLTLCFSRWLGRSGALWAAAFTAISHAMVFYSRYYVQEMLFVFFALLLLYAWLLTLDRPGWGRVLVLGAAAGLLHATKETCVLVYASLAFATFGAYGAGWWRQMKGGVQNLPPLRRSLFLAAGALTLAVVVSVTFFSSFFTWWRGPLDSVLTYGQYLHRAEGQGSAALHDKPFSYYFSLLLFTYRDVGPRWSEAPVLVLALVGSAGAFLKGGRPQQRLLAVYAWTLALLLSLVPYKTPWNLLIFYQPMLLLSGLGAAQLLHWVRRPWARAVPAALVGAAVVFMFRQTWAGLTIYSADVRNPYVYAHPSKDLVRMVDRIGEIIPLLPEGNAARIHVIQPGGDYWPLPWYLRRYEKVGYFTTLPANVDAPLLIAPPALHEQLAAHLKDQYFIQMFSLRPNVLIHLYIRQDLWDRFMSTRG